MHKIIFFTFLIPGLLAFGCSSDKKLTSDIDYGREYTGWYIGTSNAQFFVVDSQRLAGNNVGFNIPQYHQKCSPLAENGDFLNSRCLDSLNVPFLKLGEDDTTTFDQNVYVFRAKAAFLASEIDSHGGVTAKNKFKIVGRIAASNGFHYVETVLVDDLVHFRYLVLYSSCTKDSLKFPSCK